MKKIFTIIALIVSVLAHSQNEQLAQNYFEKGEFEKALVIYQDLEKRQPGNSFYITKIAATYQQLKQYDKALKFLTDKLDQTDQPLLFVEIGYNYHLQKDAANAEKYFKRAMDAVVNNPGNVYTIANAFEQKVLLAQAVKAYETAMEANKSLNFDYQMALLQGQLGNLDLMIEKLLQYSYVNQQNLPVVQNQLSRFMNEETQETFNTSLRKALLLNVQKTQDI